MEKIQLIIPSDKPGLAARRLFFSESQFGWILTGAFVLAFWGVSSTVLLVHILYNPMVVEKVVEKIVTQKAVEPVVVEKFVPVDAIRISAIDPKLVASEANDALVVRESVINVSRGQVNYQGSIINRTGTLVSGAIWVVAEYMLEDGKVVRFSSAPDTTIDKNGVVLNPEKATAFSTRNQVLKNLPLVGEIPAKAKLQRVEVATYVFKTKKLYRKFMKPSA